MRKQFSFLFLFLVAISTYTMAQVPEQGPGISARLEHEINMTKDPNLGYVPKERLINAYNMKRQQAANGNVIEALSWVERGPNSDAVGSSNGNTRPGNGKTSGRVRAIWEDLGDPTNCLGRRY
jgi:hypothetical protein